MQSGVCKHRHRLRRSDKGDIVQLKVTLNFPLDNVELAIDVHQLEFRLRFMYVVMDLFEIHVTGTDAYNK